MMFAVERNRYLRPNMPVTEQNEQSKGQPREVRTGMDDMCFSPFASGRRSEKSG